MVKRDGELGVDQEVLPAERPAQLLVGGRHSVHMRSGFLGVSSAGALMEVLGSADLAPVKRVLLCLVYAGC